MREQKSFYIFLALYLCFIIADVCFHIFGIELKFQHLYNANEVAKEVLSLTVTFLGFLIGVHFVIFQLIRHRYPVKIKNELFSDISISSKHFLLNLVVSISVLVFKFDIYLVLFPYVSHTLFCFFSFSFSISKFLKSDNTALLDSYKEDLLNTIKQLKVENKTISKYAKDLRQLTEESFSKQEIAVCNYNLQICEEINLHFIENRDRLILNKQDEDEVERVQTLFFTTITSSMKLADTYQNDNYIKKAISSLNRILKACIDCDKYDVFISLNAKLDDYFNFAQINNKQNVCISILSLYGNLFEYTIKNERRDEWIEYFIEHFKVFTLKSTLHLDDVIVKVLCNVYFDNLEELAKKGVFKHYEAHLKSLFNYIVQTIRSSSGGVDKYVQILVGHHMFFLVEKKDYAYTQKFVDRVVKLCDLAIDFNNEELFTTIIMTLNKVTEDVNDQRLGVFITDAKYELTLKLLNSSNEINSISLPNYYEIINKNNYSDKAINDVKSKFKELFHRAIIKKKIGFLLFLVERYREIIEGLDQQQRIQQQNLIELFENILHFSLSISSKECFYIILDEFNEMIEFLDKNGKISEGLTTSFIDIFGSFFGRCVKEKQNDLIFSGFTRLINLQEKLSIVIRKPELQKKIIDTLFQAGIDAIENHNEDIICNVSNHLGWSGKKAIENGNKDILEFILDKASILYNISIDLEINRKTVIFIGTLFVVLGGYIFSSKKIYIPVIKNYTTILKDKHLLKKSKDLRMYQSSRWNELMGGNAKHNIDNFMKSISLQAVK